MVRGASCIERRAQVIGGASEADARIHCAGQGENGGGSGRDRPYKPSPGPAPAAISLSAGCSAIRPRMVKLSSPSGVVSQQSAEPFTVVNAPTIQWRRRNEQKDVPLAL